MYERSISCSIGWRVTRRVGSWASSGIVRPLDVQVHDFLRVLLDVLAPWLDRLSHEDGEQRVRGQGVVDRDLFQEAPRGVHGRLPQLVGVHLSEAFVPLVRDALVPDLTIPFTSEFPSFIFVCPSNCGSGILRFKIAVRPSRTSSPSRLSPCLRNLLSFAYLMNVRARPALNPTRWVPPSTVSMLLTNVKIDSL